MKHALPLLLHSAASARDQQSAVLAQARQAQAQAQSTLERLREFRADCLARSAAGTLRGSDGAALRDYQRFVDRLDEAIAIQQHELARRAERVAGEQQRLQHCQQRVLAFEALQRREAQAAAARAQRREQRESDEFAARAIARLGSGSTA